MLKCAFVPQRSYILARQLPKQPNMRSLLLAVACCFLSIGLFAQNAPQATTIQGNVIDSSTNKPVGFATVALQNAKTHQGIKSALTKDDGSFSFKTTSTGPFELAVVFVGYKSIVMPVNGTSSDVNLGKLILQPSSNQLAEVSVTAAKRLLKLEVDRI